MGQGDAMHHAAALLPPLLESGIRLLVYAGNAGWSHALHLGPRGYAPLLQISCGNFMVFEAYSLSAVYLTPCAL